MSSEQEAILRFGIEIEKMLCEKLGKQWRPSGMSIESLVEEMSAKANAPSAYVHLPKDPDRFIALHPGDRLTVEARNPAPAPAVVRQPLTEAQITFLHDMSADGDYLDFARLIEAKHGIFEIAKVCPNCGSTETRTVSEYAGGEVVCTADQCDECNHQWNVG